MNMNNCCKMYTLAISIFSTVFLLYLSVIVAIESETLYIEVHDSMSSAFALFISALIYALIGGFLYYNLFFNLSRRDKLKLWISQRKQDIQLEQLQINRRRHRELSNIQ